MKRRRRRMPSGEVKGKTETHIIRPFPEFQYFPESNLTFDLQKSCVTLGGTAERVWRELVAIVGCSSPDGSAELDQVRLMKETLAEIKRILG